MQVFVSSASTTNINQNKILTNIIHWRTKDIILSTTATGYTITRQQQQEQDNRWSGCRRTNRCNQFDPTSIRLSILLQATILSIVLCTLINVSEATKIPSHYRRCIVSSFIPSSFLFLPTTKSNRPNSSSSSSSSTMSSSSSPLSSTTPVPTTVPASDDNNLYWNREYGYTSSNILSNDEILKNPIIRAAKIVCLSNPTDPNNEQLYDKDKLPEGCQVVHIGCTNLNIQQLKDAGCNTIFISDGYGAKVVLPELVSTLQDQLQWIHARSAGLDSMLTPSVQTNYKGIFTNSKGCFSSTLAEYTIGSCFYFAKNIPRLLQQKHNRQWNPYPVLELRGATLGIIGYGDIGQAAGRLALAMGMNVIGVTRKPRRSPSTTDGVEQSTSTPPSVQIWDQLSNPNAMNDVFAISDYVLVATPLTKDTYHLIGDEQFRIAKKDCVIINVGRGPVIDEAALIQALQPQNDGSPPLVKGAALDVTTIEPLPADSLLWSLPNVLLSPHNMDMTTTFMQEATEFYITEQLPRFVRGLPLLNPVNVQDGY